MARVNDFSSSPVQNRQKHAVEGTGGTRRLSPSPLLPLRLGGAAPVCWPCPQRAWPARKDICTDSSDCPSSWLYRRHLSWPWPLPCPPTTQPPEWTRHPKHEPHLISPGHQLGSDVVSLRLSALSRTVSTVHPQPVPTSPIGCSSAQLGPGGHAEPQTAIALADSRPPRPVPTLGL